CTRRGPPSPRGFPLATSTVLAMDPNAALFTATLGNAKFGWLKILKNSARNCRCARSLTRVDFSSEKSALFVRGPITVLRPALPNAPFGAAVNAAVLNQASQRLGPSFGLPTTFGRSLLVSPLPLGAAPFQNGVIGTPPLRM